MAGIRSRVVLTQMLLDTLAESIQGLRSAEVYPRIQEMYAMPPEWVREVKRKQIGTRVYTEPQWKNEIRWSRNTLRKSGFLDAQAPEGLWRLTDNGLDAAQHGNAYNLTGEELALLSRAKRQRPQNRGATSSLATFVPKSAEDYTAFVRGGVQLRSRTHELLVSKAGEFFRNQGAVVTTPHPIDLVMVVPRTVIFEAKITGDRDPIFAIREALGQLLMYRHFIGPRDAAACVLLDRRPEAPLVDFVENTVGMLIAWETSGYLHGGPRTARALKAAGVHLP